MNLKLWQFCKIRMVFNQDKGPVVRYSLTNALTVTLAIALGMEISGIIHQNYLKIFTSEYAVVLSISFFISVFLLWLTSSRNYEIKIDENGVQIIDEENSRSINWDDVKKLHPPTFFRHWWLFELKQGEKVKLLVHRFSRQQRFSLASEINKCSTLCP